MIDAQCFNVGLLGDELNPNFWPSIDAMVKASAQFFLRLASRLQYEDLDCQPIGNLGTVFRGVNTCPRNPPFPPTILGESTENGARCFLRQIVTVLSMGSTITTSRKAGMILKAMMSSLQMALETNHGMQSHADLKASTLLCLC